MKSEMAYKFKGAGHEEPERKREYTKVDSQLAAEFEKWLTIAGPNKDSKKDEAKKKEFFAEVFGRLKKMPTVTELHALLIKYQDRPYIDLYAPDFLNKFYNHIDEKVILYDIDAGENFCYLGQALASEKVLINKEKSGYEFGHSAKGTIINYADEEVGSSMGILLEGKFLNYGNVSEKLAEKSCYTSLCINAGSSEHLGLTTLGVVINFGKAKQFGEDAMSDSILINAGDVEVFGKGSTGHLISLKDPTKYDAGSGIILNAERCKEIPKLQKYFDALRKKVEAGRTDYKAAIKLMKTLSREKIESDLERIITGAGQAW